MGLMTKSLIKYFHLWRGSSEYPLFVLGFQPFCVRSSKLYLYGPIPNLQWKVSFILCLFFLKQSLISLKLFSLRFGHSPNATRSNKHNRQLLLCMMGLQSLEGFMKWLKIESYFVHMIAGIITHQEHHKLFLIGSWIIYFWKTQMQCFHHSEIWIK